MTSTNVPFNPGCSVVSAWYLFSSCGVPLHLGDTLVQLLGKYGNGKVERNCNLHERKLAPLVGFAGSSKPGLETGFYL